MPSSVTVSRTTPGLFSNVNSLNEVPEGALLEASNVVIDRKGMISKRRGFERYGAVLAEACNKLFEYQDRLIANVGDTMVYDSTGLGAFSAWTGTFSQPEENTDSYMHAVEFRQNFYFATQLGVYKNDALTTVPVQSGMPPGLDIDPSTTGIGGSWFTPGNSVGYRVVWGRVDRNFNLLLGAPSTREVFTNPKTTALAWARTGAGPYTITVTHTAHGYATNDIVEVSDSTAATLNGPRVITFIDANSYSFSFTGADPGASGTLSAGKKFNVSLTFTIPDGIQADDFVEIYRTADVSGEPGDRCLKVQRKIITQADLASITYTFVDTTDSAFLGDDLYSNAEVEGITQANTRPPWCTDIAVFNETLYFANTKREQAIELRLLTTVGISEGSDYINVDFGDDDYTFGAEAAENISLGEWKNFEADATLTESQKIEKSIKSLIRVINRSSLNTRIYAFYVSGIQDAPGTIRIERRTLNTTSFVLTTNSSAFGAKWSPLVPTSGDALSSDDNRGKNILCWSKFDQPEAVPEVNQAPVGAEQYAIKRIVRLKESLIIFKEDGTWRASGPPGVTPEIRQLDPTVRIVAPETAVVLDDAAWCLSTQGIVRVTESGTEIISNPIEDQLKEKIFQTFNYRFTTHACAYESAREYLLFGPDEQGSNDPETCWAYNYITQAWYRKYEKPVSAAIVPLKEDKLYVVHFTDRFILQERKSTIGILGSIQEDYKDETIGTDFVVSGSTVVTNEFGEEVSQVTLDNFTYTLLPQEGWIFTQGSSEAKVTQAINLGGNDFQLTLSKFDPLYEAGTCTLALGIASRVRWAPEEADSVALLKRWQETHIYLQSSATGISMTFEVGYTSDVRDDVLLFDEYFLSSIRRSFPEGYPFSVIRVCPLPYPVQRCRALGLILEHKYALEPWNILNVAFKYLPIGSRVNIATQ